jgi:hypothetical protein
VEEEKAIENDLELKGSKVFCKWFSCGAIYGECVPISVEHMPNFVTNLGVRHATKLDKFDQPRFSVL